MGTEPPSVLLIVRRHSVAGAVQEALKPKPVHTKSVIRATSISFLVISPP
jgi:hypothetical protein